MVRWVVGSILHGVDPLSYFSFQPVLHDWCNKGHGMCYPVCGMTHIKEPLLLINQSINQPVNQSINHPTTHHHHDNERAYLPCDDGDEAAHPTKDRSDDPSHHERKRSTSELRPAPQSPNHSTHRPPTTTTTTTTMPTSRVMTATKQPFIRSPGANFMYLPTMPSLFSISSALKGSTGGTRRNGTFFCWIMLMNSTAFCTTFSFSASYMERV